MEINKTNALKLWDERYGKQTQEIHDFAGRAIAKGQFGQTNSKKGWTIDHRQPTSNGGGNSKCNLEIVHHKTNTEKADKITFTANNQPFQVKRDKTSGSSCYIIVALDSNSQPN